MTFSQWLLTFGKTKPSTNQINQTSTLRIIDRDNNTLLQKQKPAKFNPLGLKIS